MALRHVSNCATVEDNQPTQSSTTMNPDKGTRIHMTGIGAFHQLGLASFVLQCQSCTTLCTVSLEAVMRQAPVVRQAASTTSMTVHAYPRFIPTCPFTCIAFALPRAEIYRIGGAALEQRREPYKYLLYLLVQVVLTYLVLTYFTRMPRS